MIIVSFFVFFNVLFSITMASPPSSETHTAIPTTSLIRLREAIHQKIAQFQDKLQHPVHYSVVIRHEPDGRVLYARDAHYLLMPASIQKLLTAPAALIYLKPDFQFRTSVYITGPIKQHVLLGDVIFRFTGDPTLTSRALKGLIQQLHDAGIHQIIGKIMIDNFDYDNEGYASGWLWDDLSYGYAAPVNAIILNHNQFSLRLQANAKLEEPIRLAAHVPSHCIYLINKTRTVSNYSSACPFSIVSTFRNRYYISGCYLRSAGSQQRTLPIRNLPLFMAPWLMDHLKAAGINVTHAHILFHRVPAHARRIAERLSPPLSELVRVMLKRSDNLYTHTILKKIGQRYTHHRATWRNSLAALRAILRTHLKVVIRPKQIKDGAGLSRYNLLTAMQVSTLLHALARDPKVLSVMLDALPIAGEDGTLAGRMGKIAGRVHAKTGTMTGVSALAGYIQTRHNGRLSFVVMFNGFTTRAWPYTRFQDELCEFLVSSKRLIHGSVWRHRQSHHA